MGDTTGTGTSVYVLGAAHDSVLYWKNDTPFVLAIDSPGSSLNYTAFSMAVANGHVYVCGIGSNFNTFPTTQVPCYWVDGQRVDLPDSNNSWATGIFVSGNDVYVSGYTTTAWPNEYVFYWKNGVKTMLTQPAGYSPFSSGIFVSNNDVYVVGGAFTLPSQTAGDYHYGEYWKNGVGYSLDSGAMRPQADGIFVNGNDVYCTGLVSNAGSFSSQAIYWKNGNPILLSSSPYNTRASSIFVANDTVYIAGQINNSPNFPNAVLWKNDVQGTTLLSSDYSYASCVYVSGTDVYVSGIDEIGITYVTYWKNGVAHHVSPGFLATAIVVQ